MKNTDLPSFLRRAIVLWPELHAIGPRYSMLPSLAGPFEDASVGQPLERVAQTIHAALAFQGIPTDEVNAMSAAGPAPLFAASPG